MSLVAGVHSRDKGSVPDVRIEHDITCEEPRLRAPENLAHSTRFHGLELASPRTAFRGRELSRPRRLEPPAAVALLCQRLGVRQREVLAEADVHRLVLADLDAADLALDHEGRCGIRLHDIGRQHEQPEGGRRDGRADTWVVSGPLLVVGRGSAFASRRDAKAMHRDSATRQGDMSQGRLSHHIPHNVPTQAFQ